MRNVRVLVTVGPTREAMDPVRFISNRSTGRMGFALAREAHRRGADVTRDLRTDADRAAAGAARRPRRDGRGDVPRVPRPVRGDRRRDPQRGGGRLASGRASRRRRSRSRTPPRIIEVEPTPDIAAELGRKKGSQTLVLFAAETDQVVEHAHGQARRPSTRTSSSANLVGRPGTGFDSETNEASIITRRAWSPSIRMTKDELATIVIDRVVSLRGL